MKYDVAVVWCENYEAAHVRLSIEKALGFLGGLDRFVNRKDSVLLKPNLCLPETPDCGITTHPEIVRQMANICIEAKASVTVGDNPVGMVDDLRLSDIWEKTGMKELETELPINHNFFLNHLTRDCIKAGNNINEYYTSEDLLKYTSVINLPKFKTHSLMTFTGAIKNLFGLLPGNSKRILHYRLPEREDFAAFLVLLYDKIRPKLNVMDAVISLEGEGPGKSGSKRDMHLILASESGYALDFVAAKLMNIDPMEVPTNKIAVELGYLKGFESIKIWGEDLEKHIAYNFVLPATYMYGRKLVKKLFHIAQTKVVIDNDNCRRCGLCKINCPADAVRKEDNNYKIADEKCISCMTCHEVCPNNAIVIKRPDFYSQLTQMKKNSKEELSELYTLFDRACSKYLDKIAIEMKNRKFTYLQLREFVEQATEYIKMINMDANEPLGIAFHNSIECAALLLACAKLKIPSVLFGSSLKDEMIYYINNIGISKLLVSYEMEQVLNSIEGCQKISNRGNINFWITDRENKALFREDDLYCQLTSGTSGLAKASVRTEQAVLNEIKQTIEALELTEDDSFLTLVPIQHSYGLMVGTLVPLLTGAHLYLCDQFIPADVIYEMGKNRTTVLTAVPYMYHMFIRHIKMVENREKVFNAFSSMRYCLSAGAALTKEIYEEFKALFHISITQDYGSTETGVMCLDRGRNKKFPSVGKPLKDTVIRVCNTDNLEIGNNEIGELCVRSLSTARTYICPPDLQKEKYRDGWFYTGDLGYIDDEGYVYVIGRVNDVINVAGLKVDPIEVENIIKKMNGVTDVAVVGVETNSSVYSVKAFIVAELLLTEMEVICFCRKKLAYYKVPQQVEFVKQLPRTKSGKLLRRELRERSQYD